ncbi:hypothetical protein J2S13_001500 [Oikeobacillus pervagus]|uniref:YlqD protein n=1 Tax=Oikeobacillus pervagus TaxID=1325931 RepID=A0AAJ1WKG5_9BACI|nr:YlqD family protein [Oikeobacillus pervagus]MDQ0215101.1 hypothetical protein [Oikeobacillus pervagus]
MQIIQTVTVKQVLTEKSKQQQVEKFQMKINQLYKECEQLHFEQKKMEKAKKNDAFEVKRFFKKEIDLRKEKMEALQITMDQLEILPIGSEIKERELQTIVEIHEGDSWDQIVAGKTIVVKDGIIIEIR